MADIFFSVGANTGDLKTGSPYMVISGGVMQFTIAQTGNIGVGDIVLANSIEYMIVGKTTQSQWSVRNVDGTAASPVGTPTAVTSIKRAFNTMNAAIDGTSSGIAAELGTEDLVANTWRLFIACYDDSGDDQSFTVIEDDWTTDSDYYIQIYTPINTSTQCNNSQRHDGTYDGNGYTMRSTDGTSYRWNIGGLNPAYTKVIGIKIIRNGSNWNYGAGIDYSYQTAAGSSNCGEYAEVAYNALYCDSGTGQSNAELLKLNYTGPNRGIGWYIHDNFFGSASSDLGMALEISIDYSEADASRTKLYNNTVYGSYATKGVQLNVTNTPTYRPYVKNNSVYNSGSGPDYQFPGGDFDNADSEFAYNVSDDTSAGSSNNNQQITVANWDLVDTTFSTLDLHIQSTSDLIAQGIGPASDSNVSQYDIDGDDRGAASTTTDVGADFYPSAVSVHVPQHIFQAKGAI